MYNLPYVSYGIFAFVVVAIGLLAWKKGFKAAFASFVLTLGTIGAIVGAVYGLYDHISPIFRDYIKSHFGGANGFDFSFIANEARPQVMAICIAIGFLPVFGILFGISYPLYRLLKKSDFPRLSRKLSTNSKKVKRQNKKLNKIGAIAATSVTAVATGAVVSTATSAALTTSGSFNIFNKISSYISQGATFGFGFDSVALHKMYDFIPLTNDAALMKTFGKLLMPSSKEPLTKADVDTLMKDGNLNKMIQLLEESQTEALLSVVGSALNGTEDIDYDSLKDKLSQRENLWRPLGNESSNTQYVHTTQEIEKTFTDAGVKLHIDVQTVKRIIDWVRQNGIQKFESTEAYAKWQRGQSALDALKEVRNTVLGEISSKRSELVQAIAALNNANNDSANHRASFESGILRFNELNKTNGAIDQQKLVVDEKQKIKDTMQQKYNDADKAWSDFSNNELRPAQNKYDALKQTYDTSVNDKNNAVSRLSAANNDLTNKVGEIQQATNLVKTLTNQNNQLDIEKTALETKLPSLVTKESTTKGELSSAQSAEASAQSAWNSATQALAQLNTELTVLKDKLKTETVQATIDQINLDITAKNSEINKQQGAVNNTLNALNAATATKTSAENAWNNAKKELDNANTRIAAITSQLSKNNSDINLQNSLLTNLESQKTLIKENIKTLEKEVADRTVKVAQDKIPMDTAKSVLDTKLKQYADLELVKNTASTNLQNAENELSRATAQLSNLEMEKDNLNQSITNYSVDADNTSVLEASANVEAIKWIAETFTTSTLSLTNASDFSSSKQPGSTFNAPSFTNVDVTKALADYSKSYENSLPYLTNPSGTELPKIDDKEAKHDDGSPVQSVDLTSTPPKFGTWGKLEAINFNIQEGSQSVRFLEIAKETKLTQFNQSIEDYLHILEAHLK